MPTRVAACAHILKPMLSYSYMIWALTSDQVALKPDIAVAKLSEGNPMRKQTRTDA